MEKINVEALNRELPFEYLAKGYYEGSDLNMISIYKDGYFICDIQNEDDRWQCYTGSGSCELKSFIAALKAIKDYMEEN